MQGTDLKPSSDFKDAWSEAITERLEELHQSQAWLARAVDVHPSTINRILKAGICPHDELKWKIAGAPEMRMDRLWSWPKITPPNPQQAA